MKGTLITYKICTAWDGGYNFLTMILKSFHSFKLLCFLICFSGFLAVFSCVHFRETVYLDVYRGEPISFEEMVESLTNARLIYIGEVHTLKRHHRFQLSVIEALYQTNTRLAIGLEMLPFTVQEHLDRWIEGELNEKEFLKLINWEDNWNIDFGLYKPIFDFARKKKIRLLALNAPRSLVKTVARKGLTGLTDEEKEMLPPVIPSSEEHRELLSLSLKRHKTLGGDMQRSIYEAQDVWDSTMSHYVVEYLKSEEGSDKTIVVLAGSGHMAYGYGIPARVAMEFDLPYRIIVPTGSGDIEFKEAWRKYIEPTELTHEDFSFIQRPISNFIYLVPLR